MENKRLFKLASKHKNDIDDLEDLYSDIYQESEVLREFIDFIYNARINPKSHYTCQSLNYFSDEGVVDLLENLLENSLVEN
jgi:hypothetical protein